MNKLSMAIAAAAIIGLAGAASAHHKDDHDQGQGNAYGAIGCASPSGPEQGPPGHWFQQLKESDSHSGRNPAQVAEADPNAETVADLLDQWCPPPDWFIPN